MFIFWLKQKENNVVRLVIHRDYLKSISQLYGKALLLHTYCITKIYFFNFKIRNK